MRYAFGYLFDENFPPVVAELLREERPDLPVHEIGAGDAPARGTKDPAILIWCEENGCVLVTLNRTSMPGHLRDHVDSGHSVDGIFHVSRSIPLQDLVDNLILIAELSLSGEYRNSIRFLPIR